MDNDSKDVGLMPPLKTPQRHALGLSMSKRLTVFSEDWVRYTYLQDFLCIMIGHPSLSSYADEKSYIRK